MCTYECACVFTCAGTGTRTCTHRQRKRHPLMTFKSFIRQVLSPQALSLLHGIWKCCGSVAILTICWGEGHLPPGATLVEGRGSVEATPCERSLARRPAPALRQLQNGVWHGEVWCGHLKGRGAGGSNS